jgi:hypothetical protein
MLLQDVAKEGGGGNGRRFIYVTDSHPWVGVTPTDIAIASSIGASAVAESISEIDNKILVSISW